MSDEFELDEIRKRMFTFCQCKIEDVEMKKLIRTKLKGAGIKKLNETFGLTSKQLIQLGRIGPTTAMRIQNIVEEHRCESDGY